MSSATFGQKIFKPVPPEKGSFPLDHDNVCKELMVKYMKCLVENNREVTHCREETKDYLGCRMDNSLMTKEPWRNLGLNEYEANNQTVESNSK